MAHVDNSSSKEFEVEAQRQNQRGDDERREITRAISRLPEWVTILRQLVEEARAESSASAKRLDSTTKSG